ncbi:MAG: histidine--tRNA ligase [Ignavibacteriae bacterium]|nr:MAG: histidine--tRNA ligase [Ignavibacteriota bacterium]
MITVVRGMRDIHGAEMALWHRVEDVMRRLAQAYGYEEFRTPIVEHTELFKRGVGEETDIVGKEMYTFEDRGGDSLTLRPEMTAPIVRAAIEHNLVRHQPTTRLWYMGPLFRYERPQKGRYRQFHQFGAECLGSPHPEADVEIIMLAAETLRELGIPNVKLEINSLGTSESRAAYRQALVDYLTAHRESLSADSQRRLETNPLRVLDSKDDADKRIVANAPLLQDHLDEVSRTHFNTVQVLLQTAGIPFTVNPVLVRGLDYYCHTVFEFTSTDLGSQNTVCGGGRYDPLFTMIGGGDVPAVGFSIGMERLIILLEQAGGPGTPTPPDIYLCAMGDEARIPAQLLALRLRREGWSVVTDVLRRSGKAQLKDANRFNVRYTLILGDEELASGTIAVKNMADGQQTSVAVTDVASHLQRS